MKTHPFSYLKKAPRLPGLRRLRIDEKALKGDRYTFLEMCRPDDVDNPLANTNELTDTGTMQIGRSLRESAAEWTDDITFGPFNGILYRPAQ